MLGHDPRDERDPLPLVDSKDESIHPSRIENTLEELLRKDPLVIRVARASACTPASAGD
jgi:hypothetical protein